MGLGQDMWLRLLTKVYGDEAQFTKQNDKFTALLFTFPLHRVKGWMLGMPGYDMYSTHTCTS